MATDKPLRLIIRKSEKQEVEITLDDLALVYARAKERETEATLARAVAEQDLVEALEKNREKTHEVRDGGKYKRVTFTQQERTKVDEEGLQKKLGKVKYRQLCDLKLSQKKLNEALEAGDVSATDVEPFAATTRSKPYITYSVRSASDDESESSDDAGAE